MIRQEREKLHRYTARFSERFTRYRDKIDASVGNRMIGGEQASVKQNDLNSNERSGSEQKKEKLDPKDLIYSQSSVRSPKYIDTIRDSMKEKEWDGAPVDVVRMPDGKLTSADNKRLLAATDAEISVLACIYKDTDILPEKFLIRFTVPGHPPSSTWGEAIMLRVENQPSFWMRFHDPYGTYDKPHIMGINKELDQLRR